MTDQEVYQALTEDFLERDGNTFVRIRRNERLGWEETLPPGTAYSEKMLSPKNTEELLKAAYSHASDMIKAMNTPFDVRVNVSGESSWTNSKVVYVGSSVLTDTAMSIGQRLDVFTGYAVHEGSHLLYTDFNAMSKRKNVNEIVRDLSNILEDEMIEIKLGEEKPGLANFIAASKYHAFGCYVDDIDTLNQKNNRLQQILNAILSMVRYPKLLTPEIVQNYGRLLLRCRQVITPYPTSTEKVCDAAMKIYDIIIDEYKDEIEKEQQEQQQQQEQQEQMDQTDTESQDSSEGANGAEDDQTSDGENGKEKKSGGSDKSNNEDKQSDPDDSKDSKDSKESNKQSTQKGQNQTKQSKESAKDNGSSSQQNGNSQQSSNTPDTEKVTDQQIKQMIEDEFNKIKDALQKLASEPKTGLEKNEIANDFKKENKTLALECEGVLERGVQDKSVIIKAEENRPQYMRSLERIRKYIPAVNRILRSNGTEYKTTLRGLRSGMMDPCKIAEAYQGVASVYMREGKVKADNMNIALLIDESGSMDGNKIEAARDTAILFREALKTVPNVELYIYGYTSSGGTTLLMKYIEPRYNPKFSLGSMDARCCTPTKKAIVETMARLPIADDKKTLLVVISDGCPDGPTKEVAEEIKKAERKGVKVMGISIDDGLSENTLKQMYGNYIKFTDMTRLVSMLGKVLKKEVLDNTTKKHCA